MTKEEFDKLDDGTKVWYAPTYFAFPMLGVIKTIGGEKGVWVNFYGEGQCLFTPPPYSERWYTWVLPYTEEK